MAHWIMDLITLAILGLCFWSGWRKGFFRSLIYVIGCIALYITSHLVSRKAAPILYEKFVGPYFIEKIELYISNVGDGVRIESVIINALNKIPSFCKDLILGEGNIENFIEKISALADSKVENVAHLLVYDCMPEVIIPLIQGILFLVLLILLFLLFKWLVQLLGNQASKKTLVGRIDGVIGGICGLGIGFIIMLVLTFVLRLVIGFTADQLSWCSTAVIENTFLFKLIYNIVTSGMVGSIG